MAADVSYLVRLMDGGDSKESSSPGKSTAPMMTRDLLSGYCTLDSKELDLDLQVPCGWEKRLDLKSGKVYLQRCNNSSNNSSEKNNKSTTTTTSKFQDLNFPPEPKRTLNLFDDESTNLDLKLVSLSPQSTLSPSYICTLDKVKSALERAEKETTHHHMARKRSISMCSKNSSPLRSNNDSSSSIKDDCGSHEEKSSFSGSFAAGCPSCLLYVLISKSNPRCPRCSCVIPFPVAVKKPRIDLNISI